MPTTTASISGDYVAVDGVRLWVERAGEGPVLLLIPGLGTGNWLWRSLAASLAGTFTLVMPELRGSARSDKPDQPYTVPLFASDLLAVLDHFHIDRTHVLGASMGGFIAQHLAATAPSRVMRLVLVATSLGGARQIGPEGSILARTIRPRGRSRRERLEDGYELGFSPAFRAAHREQLHTITEWRLSHPQPEWAYYRQLLAGWAFDGVQAAQAIEARTLICAAEEDPVVPIANAYALRDHIPTSRLALFKGRHLFVIEHYENVARAVTQFLLDGTTGERA